MANKLKIILEAESKVRSAVLKAWGQLKGFGNRVKKLGAGMARVFRGVVTGIVAVGASAAAAVGKALSEFGKFQQIQTRLEAILGSAEKGKKVFEEIKKFAGQTPLQLADLVEARILLEGVGVTGQQALEDVAEGAAALGRNIQDVAMAVASMETEPLRRMGIQLRKAGELFTFTFRDRAGKEIRKTANGIDDARRALLAIMQVKFGGTLAKTAKTLMGQISTLKDNAAIALATVGKAFADIAAGGLKTLTDKIADLVQNGKLEAWAKGVAERFQNVIESAKSIIAVFAKGGGERQQLVQNLGKIIVTSFQLGAMKAVNIIADGMRFVWEKFHDDMIKGFKVYARMLVDPIFAAKQIGAAIGRGSVRAPGVAKDLLDTETVQARFDELIRQVKKQLAPETEKRTQKQAAEAARKGMEDATSDLMAELRRGMEEDAAQSEQNRLIEKANERRKTLEKALTEATRTMDANRRATESIMTPHTGPSDRMLTEDKKLLRVMEGYAREVNQLLIIKDQ